MLETKTVSEIINHLKSKSKNTAIEDKRLQGKVLMTFLKGEPVFKI